MATKTLLDSLQAYLATPGLLDGTVKLGVAEPVAATDLPAVVLSLLELTIPSPGLGEHTEAVTGALDAATVVDLANPLLTEAPGLSLLSEDRRSVLLHHGGLVDKDGSNTPLGATDIQVDLDGAPISVVESPPAAGQVSVSPQLGRLQFSTPLPDTGRLSVDYFIGHWERKVRQLGGLLEVAVVHTDNGLAIGLSNAVLSAMAGASAAISGLRQLEPASIAAVTEFELASASQRQRRMSWRFDYENIVDRPQSSGGIIQRIKLLTSRDSAPFEEEEIA